MTTKANDGGPAYPMHVPAHSGFGPHEHPGMTLRDHFAGLAMQGMYSCQDFMNEMSRLHPFKSECREAISRLAYAQADAMIAEREKGGAE